MNTMASTTPTTSTANLMGGGMSSLFGSMPTNSNGQDLSDILVGSSLMG